MNKRIMVVVMVCGVCSGCGNLRFAPSEAQKQNAWIHLRTAEAASSKAQAEQTSEQLRRLAALSARQSRAVAAYHGLPENWPPAESDGQVAELISESNYALADEAFADAGRRPDPWQVADAGFELALCVAGLVGGVYGTRAVKFIQKARTKSQALQEVIAGNELFKQQNADRKEAFGRAHQLQSAATRQIVAETKTTA